MSHDHGGVPCGGHDHHEHGHSHSHQHMAPEHGGHTHDGQPCGGHGAHEDVAERQHFDEIVNAMRYYPEHTARWIDRAERTYQGLPPHQKQLVPLGGRIRRMREAKDANWALIKHIVAPHQLFENGAPVCLDDSAPVQPAREDQMDKLRSTLRQFVRDWSEDGRAEREACYTPIIEEIVRRFPPDVHPRNAIRVLVPGAGLARLAWELVRRGYAVEGCEWSYFMLLSSQFVLNRAPGSKAFAIYPWLHSMCNLVSVEDALRPVSVPDVDPTDIPPGSDFSMSAGDFVEVYSQGEHEGAFDAVATAFFIDTAHNVLDYLTVLAHILRENGVWVNVGPLLWHWADMPREPSLELAWDELRPAIEAYGFDIEEEGEVQCAYAANPRSMMQSTYRCVRFVAVKRREPRVPPVLSGFRPGSSQPGGHQP
eukprot:tig00001239_g7765.t1